MFEWDEKKAAANIAKHNITFEMACDVFKYPFVMEWDDYTQGVKEHRSVALGMVKQRILYVVYTMRNDNIRIISAYIGTAC